jgi:2'-5' RNA ligase
MADLGFPSEARRYKPHITLGRLKKGRRVSEPCIEELRKLATTEFGTIPVAEIAVISSELTKEGPIYTPMSHVKLSAA